PEPSALQDSLRGRVETVMTHKPYAYVKRSLYVFCALTGLVLLSPLLILIAVAIKVGSPGPVLYRGVRVGRRGRPFRICKFRTMVVNADQLGGPSTSH